MQLLVEFTQRLGNLIAIAEGMTTLRNSYGSGHGRAASYKGLEERHAKLAVGSTITLVEFCGVLMKEQKTRIWSKMAHEDLS